MKLELEAIVKELDSRETLSALLPKQIWSASLEARIDALEWNGRDDETAVIALMAGLHLRNDSLDASHSYAQQIEHDATGAYWHGIMHRMEGDFFNSKYWFRQAGRHPAMERTRLLVADWLDREPETELSGLDSYAQGILASFRSESGWDPSRFVDLIVWQEKQGAAGTARPLLEKIQRIEIQTLFAYTLEKAQPYLTE
ncbi:hypothetical protein D3P08_00810 [Paenibacillus nanensis]|uniref:Uncharacterized protein n=1 Tax=Paenibacillus nanensis TaxID=393251 RepID=A0A3A1VI34_9BACL|nr:hypothetical protein [Paenibacillus nanensis]RIX60157.1 hypothetical protein D3P08_00810 [Paenibacillus nanensis]